MSAIEPEDAHGNRPAGADAGDDGDVPEDPLLGGNTADEPPPGER